MDREELAWCAGFFDGEGNVGAFNRNKGAGYSQPRLIIQIVQTDLYVLQRFCDAMGVGKVLGPYTPKTENSSPYWSYKTESFESVQHIITLMWNWLSPQKKADAVSAIGKARAWMVRTECKLGHEVSLMRNGRIYCPTCRSTSARNRSKVVN